MLATAVSGCAQQNEVWGISRETFSQRLERGEYEFLRHLDYGALDLDEVLRLEPGAAYYLAQVYAELGLTDMEQRMLALELDEGEDPWRRHAALELVSELAASEQFRELEKAADRALELYPEEPELVFARHAALYEQGRDRDLSAAYAEGGSLSPFLSESVFSEKRREAQLWKVVSAFRLGDAGWADGVRSFFTELPAASQHSRLYVFLIARSAAQKPFSAAELSLFSAKARLAEGEVREAARVFSELARDARRPAAGGPGAGGTRARGPAGLELTEWVVRDMGVAFLRAGYWSRGAVILEGYAEETRQRGTRAMALEYAGRLHRAAGDAGLAAERFEAALSLRSAPANRRRLVWNLTDATMRFDPEAAVGVLAEHRAELSGAGYFARLLDRLATELVRAEEWEALRAAGRVVEEAGFVAAADQFRFLGAEAALRGRTEGADSARDVLAEVQSDPYYRLLAAVRLGNTDSLVREPARVGAPSGTVTHAEVGADGNGGDGGPDGAGTERDGGSTAQLVVHGYLAFGLYEHAYRAAMERDEELSVETIEEVVEHLQARGLLIESLRLMARVRDREEFVLTTERARMLYPRAFSHAMEQVAEQEGLDMSVFYGLVREESHFDADIVSHAGATGLAQLMPSTAADVARRMRMADPDLTDPATNLAIGGYYLSYLLGRFDGELLAALAAYNGGQGRVRRWQAELSAFSGPLFHEAMPIRETRHYIRKVLVSAAYYGELYDERSVGDTVRLFYPDVKPIEED